MGQKVHPKGFRIGIIEDWDAYWYSEYNYAALLEEDLKLRKFIKERLYRAGVSRIKIARRANQIEIDIYAARPGLIIGKSGKDISFLREQLIKLVKHQIQVNVKEEPHPDLCSQLVAENIAIQLEKRVAYRKAMKQALTKTLRIGAKGMKIRVAGRLNGSDIARKEWYRKGRVPLHTLRADINYGFAEALTVYGKIGVQVWIFRGEIIGNKEKKEESKLEIAAVAKQSAEVKNKKDKE